MSFTFNAAAVIQALAGIILIGLIHLVLLPFGFHMIGGNRELFVSLLILAFITATMDARGYKGWVLLYIPTWIAALIGAVIAFRLTYTGTKLVEDPSEPFGMAYVPENTLGYALVLYTAIPLIVVYYIRTNRKYLVKNWETKLAALQQLSYRVEAGILTPEERWKELANVYFNPPHFFLFMNPIWKRIFGDVPSGDDFLRFYRQFMGLVDIPALEKERFIRWMTEFKAAVDEAGTFAVYQHPSFALQRLGELINKMNGQIL